MARSDRFYRVVVDWYNDDLDVFDFCGTAWAEDRNDAVKQIAKRTAIYYLGESEPDDEDNARIVEQIEKSIYPDRVTDVVDEIFASLQQLILGQEDLSSAQKCEAFSHILKVLSGYGIFHSRAWKGCELSLEEPIRISRYVEDTFVDADAN